MNAKPITDWNKLVGTHGQGTIETTRGALVRAFGEPQFEELTGDKISVEWSIEFEDGTIATIYDWKRYGSGYYGEDEEDAELLGDNEPYDYSIGGESKKAYELVVQALKAAN